MKNATIFDTRDDIVEGKTLKIKERGGLLRYVLEQKRGWNFVY